MGYPVLVFDNPILARIKSDCSGFLFSCLIRSLYHAYEYSQVIILFKLFSSSSWHLSRLSRVRHQVSMAGLQKPYRLIYILFSSSCLLLLLHLSRFLILRITVLLQSVLMQLTVLMRPGEAIAALEGADVERAVVEAH